MKRAWMMLAVPVAVFTADRASKIWIDNNVSAFDTLTVIPGFFNIIHAENRGMAFSLLADSSEFLRKTVLVGLSGALTVLVGWMLWQALAAGNRLQQIALGLILGGAVGNLWDRVERGAVTDFLDFYAGSYHWATFNIADTGITSGAILLGIEMLINRKAAS
ncbi:MAG: signal peptidase II [Acidobacteria bacterium]|nr:signal peptidase II [Acidobacteriota bacterium]